MSPISDPVSVLPLAEQQRWRHELDRLAEDACGCRPAAATLVIATVGSAVTVLRSDRRSRTAVVAACVSFAATLGSKLAAQYRASGREQQLRTVLDQRIAELAGEKQGLAIKDGCAPTSRLRAAPASAPG